VNWEIDLQPYFTANLLEQLLEVYFMQGEIAQICPLLEICQWDSVDLKALNLGLVNLEGFMKG
jgi:hypothetical protein